MVDHRQIDLVDQLIKTTLEAYYSQIQTCKTRNMNHVKWSLKHNDLRDAWEAIQKELITDDR